MEQPQRKYLCASYLIKSVFKKFSRVPHPDKSERKRSIAFADHLMSGLAIFGLKFPSLLAYDEGRIDETIEKNLRHLYHVNKAPSDTYLREQLDKVNPDDLRPAFKGLFSLLQRGNELKVFQFLDGYYLLSLDGTGSFSSSKIACKHCCKKEHKSGQITYYHQMLGGCIVHPDLSAVIPLCPEPIYNDDGYEKNDCERNATKRFVEHFRREHPHLKVIVIADGLASNAPNISLLESRNIKYIIGAKPGDHKFLFEQIDNDDTATYHEFKDDRGFLHQFRFINNVPLNKSNLDLKVNFFEYRQTDPKGKELNFSWVTNIPITKENVFKLMKGGRARWKIENETFNTLKNLGYNLEHNYGHGKQYLSTVFCMLMMLAFLIDEIQKICCSQFQMIRNCAGTYRDLWSQMRVIFKYVETISWEMFYQIISKKHPLNTS